MIKLVYGYLLYKQCILKGWSDRVLEGPGVRRGVGGLVVMPLHPQTARDAIIMAYELSPS